MSDSKLRIVIQAVDQMTRPMQRMRDAASRLQGTVGQIKAYNKAHRAMLEHKRDLADAQRRTRELALAMRESGGGTKAQARAFRAAREQAARLKQTIASESEALERMRRELRAAGVDTRDLAAEQARLERKAGRLSGALDAAARVQSGVRRATSAMMTAGLRLGGAFAAAGAAVAGLGRMVNNVFVRPAAQFEQFRTVLETIEGSSARARASMSWIQDFASTTPYELTQVTDAFVKLRAYGLDPTHGLLRTLGDTASAMGKPLDQAVEAIADATTGEYERLKEFGIKAFTKGNQTAFQYTDRNGRQMVKVVNNRNRAMIQSTLEAIWNEKYAGAMQKQSHTWNGMMSNLGDWWTKFVNMVMDSGAFDALKAKLAGVLDAIREMNRSGELKQWAERIGHALMETISVVEALGHIFAATGRIIMGVLRGVWWLADKLTWPLQKLFKGIEWLSDKLLSNNVIGDFIGKAATAMMAGLGSSDAQRTLALNARAEGLAAAAPTIAARHTGPARAEVGGTLKIEIAGAPARVRRLETRGGMGIDVATGPIPVGAP